MKYDKDSFLTVPNKKFLEGQPSQLQTIYFWIVDHADKNGKCFPGRKRIAKLSKTNVKTVDKYIKVLSNMGILVKTNRVKGNGENMSNEYQIMVIDYVGGGGLNGATPRASNGATPGGLNGAISQPNIKSTQLNIAETSSAPVFDWSKSQKKMEEKAGSDMDIIATYLTEKGIIPESSAQLSQYIKRYRKTAMAIAPFIDGKPSRLFKVIDEIKEESVRLSYEWSLETIYKKITKKNL